MQRELIVKSASLGGNSDLTLLAPITPGLVDSLETVSHKTRIKRVLALLHAARKSAHEHAAARLISDAVERVGVIHSVRVAVLEAEDKVLLAVTFDGPWEAYIRVLWQRVGSLLDLIFCSTDGYVVAATHSFDQWLGWARRVQVETDFFYGPGASSAHDLLYLRRVQLMRQAATPPTLLALQEQRAVMPDALIATERLVDQIERVADDPPVEIIDTFQMARQRVRQGVQALAAFYRLVDLFPPGTAVSSTTSWPSSAGASRARSTGCSPTPLRRCRGRRPCRRPSPTPCRPRCAPRSKAACCAATSASRMARCCC